ncbi:MAG TPA: patatin-like phospholipase family protein [Stellaceae bacterium]|nr:patatin-like phospholipase family protein [Stellaceae bacterium]
MTTTHHPHRRTINLALQGGGTHGAFTWGVLDRLLEDERIAIEGISGASAGAMNGAVLAQGMHLGGPKAAREALDHFWHRMAEIGWYNPIRRTWIEKLQGTWNLDRNPIALAMEQLTLFFSPYQTNPLNLSHVRELLDETIDVSVLRDCNVIKLFVGTTNVRTSQPRIFRCSDLSIDALLASACVPQVYQSVMIDGDAYWDGGYLGNPPLWPLIYECKTPDIMIVQINPIRREGVPQSPAEITNRLNEIVFNASLMAQLRAISFVAQLIGERGAHGPHIDALKKKNLFIHLIEAEEAMRSLGAVSQLNTDLEFLLYLKKLGRDATEQWLDAHFHDLNHHQTFDIDSLLLDTGSKSSPLLTWPDA